MGRITNAEYQALADFRYALRHFLGYSERAAAAAGLTPQQHQALLAIRGFRGRGTITVGELAERMQLRHHSAVGLLDRLSARGLVKRRTSGEDRRQVWISLTARGLESLEQLTSSHREELLRIGPNLRQVLDQLSREES